MNIPLLNWFVRSDGLPLLTGDLRSGRAGLGLRLALSVAALGVCIALMLACLGAIYSLNGRVEDEHAFIGLALTGVAWCAALGWLWNGYRKWQRTLRTIFGLISLWALVIPLTVGIEAVLPQGELLIVACIVMGLATTLAVIATVAYRSRGGRPVHDAEGHIHVQCPRCGYSMIGLETCQCPECGHRCTIDALIAAQDYATLQLPHGSSNPDQSPSADALQLVAPEAMKALPQGEP